MTPESQRIAIAEACGWTAINKPLPDGEDCFRVRHPDGYIPERGGFGSPGGAILSACPDYLSDLNAMAEAEKTLTPRQRQVYADLLYRIADPDWEGDRDAAENEYIGYIEVPAATAFEIYHATAAQRAEAFLRATGRWVES